MSVDFVASISYTAQRLGSSISDQNSVKLLWLQRIKGFIIRVIVPVNIEFTQSRRGRTARKKGSGYENVQYFNMADSVDLAHGFS
jgi:hypothetical protein